MGIDKFASTATIVRPELRKKENTLTIIEEQIEKLRELIRNKQSIIVAFSGGVDSSVIAKIAYEELKDNSMAVTIDSDTFSRRELKMSRQTAKEIGISHQVMKTSTLPITNIHLRTLANRRQTLQNRDLLRPITLQRNLFFALGDYLLIQLCFIFLIHKLILKPSVSFSLKLST